MPTCMRSRRETLFNLAKGAGLLLGLMGVVLAVAWARGLAAEPDPHARDVVRPAAFDADAFVANTRPTVNGPQLWATLLCKFSDVSDEPQGAAFFNDMFERTSGPSLSEYWQEVSYGNIPSITTDAHGWFTLRHDRSHYGFSASSSGYDVTPLVQDCVDAADAAVDFAPYDAVAVILNSPSPVAITTLFPISYPDGATINLGAISIPSNKYNLALMAHEMGHAYGLPHSSANGDAYRNPWDVMGIASSYRCSVNADPIYSCLGQHTIAQYKDELGWIESGRRFVAPQGESTITLERLAQPQTNNYLMAVVYAANDTFVVEARQRVGYDTKLAGDAVLIHRGQGDDLIDADGPPYDDDGAMWLPGETYTDAANGLSIRVDAATATGYTVTINNQNSPPADQPMTVQLSATPTTPAANDRVDFNATITYEDASLGTATNVAVTVTFPGDVSYVAGSATTNMGVIVSEDPLVVNVASLLSFFPLSIDYAATVNGNVTGPTLIQVPVDVSWDGGSLTAQHTLIANTTEQVQLPLLRK